MDVSPSTHRDTDSLRLAADEKRRVAASSVMAAVVLTVGKLTVGYWTDSLGILSEAAHSGLDLVAAFVTLIAVRASARPADREHTYGHGKVENLSALLETALLLLTCIWIIYEAVHRLCFEDATADVTVWSFAVILVSIAIDISRSRALMRVAKKYQSQALEADALHFSTDIWSSVVVLGGLACMLLSKKMGIPWLARADSVAALGVAGIVVWISIEMGRKTIGGLLDAVPPGLQEAIARAAKVPGVHEVVRVRVRRSGPETFADVTLAVKRELAFESAHETANKAEAAVRAILPEADVVVHVEPIGPDGESLLSTVRVLAARYGLGAHGILIAEQAGTRSLEMHLEVSDELRVVDAHQKANAFEADVRRAHPEIEQITTHLEPVGEATATQKALPADEQQLMEVLRAMPQRKDAACRVHSLKVRRVGKELAVSLHCAVDPATNIGLAHALTTQIEQYLRGKMKTVGRVVIHVEPDGGDERPD